MMLQRGLGSLSPPFLSHRTFILDNTSFLFPGDYDIWLIVFLIHPEMDFMVFLPRQLFSLCNDKLLLSDNGRDAFTRDCCLCCDSNRNRKTAYCCCLEESGLPLLMFRIQKACAGIWRIVFNLRQLRSEV